MDPFEENLMAFESTKYGTEMKESLKRCFNLLFTDLVTYGGMVNNIEQKIENLEKGG